MANFIIKYRWVIISVAILLGAGFGLLIPSAETDPEIRNYVPRSMPSRVTTDSIEQQFGVQDMIVTLFTDSSILNEPDLKQIKNVDRAFSRLGGLGTVNSLFTARDIRGEEGMMMVDPLIGDIPETDEQFADLREKILSNNFARDIVVSSDFTAAAITGTINRDVPESETLGKIDSIIASTGGGAEILTGGLPYIRRFIIKDVNRDAMVLIPLALLIMLTVLKLTLKDWKSVLMPFSVVVLSTAVSMGLIPLLGWKISIISLLVPIIMISVANNYGIYLVSKYQELCREEVLPDRRGIIESLTGSLNKPILFSGLTTVAGILGLLAHSIIPAKQLGVLAAIGVSVALALSMLFIPAMISFRKPVKKLTVIHAGSGDHLDRIIAGIASTVIKRPGRVLLISAVVTLLISTGIFLVRTDTNQENYFPQKHPVRKASEIINAKFGGSQTISVMVSGDIKDPLLMKKIDDLTIHLKGVDGVGNVFSISDVVKEMSKALYEPNEPEYDQIPASGAAIAQMFELYNMSGDPDDFKQLMNFENTSAHILIRLSKPDNEVIRAVRDDIGKYTADFPAEVTIGGYAIIMADFARKIIHGQLSSLFFALLTVFILLSIIFRSVKGGLTGSIPLAASIIIQFGFMGLCGIAIDAATALLSSIMIGVGVDFTIQYLWRYNSELKKGLSYRDAIIRTYNTTGRSIIINALSVMAGFSATFFSGFLSIRFFGYMVLLSIGSCLVFAIIVIPAFVLKFKPAFIEAEMAYKNNKNKRNEKDFITVTNPGTYVSTGYQGTAARSCATDGKKS
jgi:hydrophobe/amphiphile efflux-3 (HAE3) family protein